MEISDSESMEEMRSENSSDPESDLATILNYLNSGQSHILSSDRDESEEESAAINNKSAQSNTEMLDKCEISIFTKQSAGLINKVGEERPKSIAGMICARERGLNGSTNFSKADCCKINNNFLPNQSHVVGRYPTKIFCGIYLDNGNAFLSASQDRKIRLFNAKNGNFKLIKTIMARDVGWSILDVAISPDGQDLAYSSWCECLQLCKLWEDSDNQEALLICPEESKSCIFSIKFSSNGGEILCGASRGYIYVYDREYNQRTFKIIGHDDDVNSVAFAEDRSQILYTGGDDGICKVWDRRMLSKFRPKPVGCLAGHMLGITCIEPRGDGRHLLTNSKDQSIKLWDIRKFSSEVGVKSTQMAVMRQSWDYRWKQVPKSLNDPRNRLKGDTSIMTYRGHSVRQTLCRCYFSPQETTGQRYIYTGCAAGRVIIYDVLTGKVEKELKRHVACVRDAAWHPYRPEIMSVSWDGHIINWTYQEKNCLDSDYDETNICTNLERNERRRR